MQKERYLSKQKSLKLKDGQKVSWSLSPNFGILTVNSSPSGLSVKLNGKSIVTTPINDHELSPGRYRAVIEGSMLSQKRSSLHHHRQQKQNRKPQNGSATRRDQGVGPRQKG